MSLARSATFSSALDPGEVRMIIILWDCPLKQQIPGGPFLKSITVLNEPQYKFQFKPIDII